MCHPGDLPIAKTITQYRVFVASPGGLEDAREHCTLHEGVPRGRYERTAPASEGSRRRSSKAQRADRYAEAIAVYDDVIGRFGAAGELPLREEVARALYNKGFVLGMLDRTAEAIATYDDVIGRFGTAGELTLREEVANALINKGIALTALGRNADAVAAYDDVDHRFGTAGEPSLRERVAAALVVKGQRSTRSIGARRRLRSMTMCSAASAPRASWR